MIFCFRFVAHCKAINLSQLTERFTDQALDDFQARCVEFYFWLALGDDAYLAAQQRGRLTSDDLKELGKFTDKLKNENGEYLDLVIEGSPEEIRAMFAKMPDTH
jgi:hypothetical protein